MISSADMYGWASTMELAYYKHNTAHGAITEVVAKFPLADRQTLRAMWVVFNIKEVE